MFQLLHGDCIEQMRAMPDNSVDSIVTDPPYGLEFMGKDWDAPWKSGVGIGGHNAGFSSGAPAVASVRGEIKALPSYMGSTNPSCVNCGGTRNGNDRATRTRCKCDNPVFPNTTLPKMEAFQHWCEEWAMEALRVLKPGGHLLAFSGSRTYHRMACAIEDAGFEIRDQIMWLYGSGFPKSLDVSKAIDKQRDDRDDVLKVTAEIARLRDVAGMTNRDLDDLFGFAGMAGHWTSVKSQPTVPTIEQWFTLRQYLKPDDSLDAEVWRLNGRKGTPGEAWELREVVGSKTSGIANKDEGQRHTIGASKSVVVDITAPATPAAREWQGWGTALKPAHEPIVVARKPLVGTVAANVLAHGTGALNIDGTRVGGNAGRWPAKVIHDGSDEVLAGFPNNVKGKVGMTQQASTRGLYEGGESLGDTQINDGISDSGSAARFFYCAKASKRDRNEGTERNGHPTVKPTELMRYLVRLVTPPNGTVLDPFTGSGSTGKACMYEGFQFIGIEQDADYIEIARARIQWAADNQPEPTLFDPAENHSH